MSSQYPPNGQPPQYPQQPQYPQYPQQQPLEPHGQRSYQTVPLAPGQGYPPQYAQQPSQAPKKTNHPWLVGCSIAIALLIALCLVTAVVQSLVDRANGTFGVLPTATIGPAPTATTDPATAAYVEAVNSDAQLLYSDLINVSSVCGNAQTANDLYNCRQAVDAAHTDAVGFQTDLKTYPAPDCLADANTTLTKGINAMVKALAQITKGIDDFSGSEVRAGSAALTAASQQISQANTQIGQATCP